LKTLITILLLSVAGFSQVVEKKAGDTVYVEACGAEGDTLRFYRQTTAGSSPVLIGQVSRLPNKVECKEVQWLMPTGTTQYYRFYAVPSLGTEMLNSTNGERVKRKK